MPNLSDAVPTRRSGRRAGASERNNAKGEATRQLILSTAERLFAEHGIAAVPLREIGDGAGQKNNVAVRYHFGGREGLVTEIIAHRAGEREAARMEMLTALLAEGRPPAVSDLVRVFVHPMARHLDQDNHYLAFLSRYIIERGGYTELKTVHSEAITTLMSILPTVMPDYPEHLLEERWVIMMTSAVHTLARYQVLGRAGRLDAPIDDLLADLERYLTAGIEAPYERPAPGGGPRPAGSATRRGDAAARVTLRP